MKYKYADLVAKIQNKMIPELAEYVSIDMVEACIRVRANNGSLIDMRQAVMNVLPPMTPDEGDYVATYVVTGCSLADTL